MDLQIIQSKIYEIRGYKVMLDFDLAALYQVPTKRLKEQVKRNSTRFPGDFMFELSNEEYRFLRSQFATLENPGKGHYSKYLPYAFTEQGVAMLSSVLNSPVAIEVNISIMRAFVRLRELITGYTELNRKLEEFMVDTDMRFADVMDIINEMLREKQKNDEPRKRIGFIKEE